MSEFKFLCPACSQRIQCDTSHSGRALDCPSCHSSLKVPQPRAGKSDETLPKAELLRKGKPIVKGGTDTSAKKSSAELRKSSSTPPPAPPKNLSTAKKPEARIGSKEASPPAIAASAAPSKPPDKAPAPKPPKTEVRAAQKPQTSADGYRVRCPVCDSKLHLMESRLAEARENFVEAKVVAQGTRAPKPDSDAPPAAEKKEPAPQVKTGRPGEVMKPRLSYILTGKPPKPKE